MEVNPTLVNATTPPTKGARIYPAFSLVRPTFSSAKSWYDSFQATGRLLPWHGINALASYTHGHAIDHDMGHVGRGRRVDRGRARIGAGRPRAVEP